jgi:hypothetical protein
MKEMIDHIYGGGYVAEPEPDGRPAPTPSRVVGDSVRALRKAKGWTQQQLADRLAELGVALDQSTIARIEYRRPDKPRRSRKAADEPKPRRVEQQRKVTVDEAYALAAALCVPISALMVPRESRRSVAVTPTVTVPGRTAYRAFLGEVSLTAATPEDLQFFEAARPDFEREAFQRLPWLRLLVSEVNRLVESATISGESAAARSALFRFYFERVQHVLDEIGLDATQPEQRQSERDQGAERSRQATKTEQLDDQASAEGDN